MQSSRTPRWVVPVLCLALPWQRSPLPFSDHANELSSGADPGILDTLAAAVAEAGQFGDARSTARKALELAQAAGRQDLVKELKGEMKRYDAGLPCRP